MPWHNGFSKNRAVIDLHDLALYKYLKKSSLMQTIMPMATGGQTEIEVADYIWVSSP